MKPAHDTLALLGACWLVLTAVSCDPSPGAGAGADGTAANAATVSESTSLTADLDALLADDDTLLANWAKVFESINDTLDRVHDADSAREVLPRLQAITDGPLARLRKLREQGVFRPQDGESALVWLGEHNRSITNLTRLSADPTVQPVLEQPLDRLMRFFDPVD